MGRVVEKSTFFHNPQKIFYFFALFILSFCLFSFNSGDPFSLVSLCHYTLACETLVFINTSGTLFIGVYNSSLSPRKTCISNKLYFDFKLNCTIECVKCVCFDIDNHPFFFEASVAY